MLRHRKIAPAAICFCIGIVTAMNANGFFLALIFAIAGVLCLFFTAAHRFFSLNTKGLAVFTVLFLIGALYVTVYGTVIFGSAQKYVGKTDVIKATVIESDDYISAKGVTLEISDSRLGLSKGTKVRMNCSSDAVFDEGDTVIANVGYYENKSLSNKGEFIYLSCSGRITSAADGGNVFVRLRQNISSVIGSLYGQGSSAYQISNAATGADKGAVDSYTYAVFRNAGVSHLLVVSGLHVSILTLAAASLLRLFRVPMRMRYALSFVLAVLYCAFVGFTPSVLRTLVMLAFVTFDKILLRHHDSINSLFVSLTIIAVINPYLLSSLSTQLSYCATFAILVILPKVEDRIDTIGSYILKKLVGFFAIPLAISVSVAIVTMPISVMNGGTVSYIAPIINMTVTAIFGYVLVLDVLAIILFAITGFAHVGIVAKFCYDSIYSLLCDVYQLGIGSVSTAMPGFAMVYVFAVAFIVAIMLFSSKKRRIAAISTAALCVISIALVTLSFNIYNNGHTVVYYTETNTEKSVFISSQTQNVYFDLGNEPLGDILPQSVGFTSIDKYVMQCDDCGMSLRNALSKLTVKSVYLTSDISFETTVSVMDLAAEYGFEPVLYFDYNELCDDMLIGFDGDCLSILAGEQTVSIVMGDIAPSASDIVALAFDSDVQSVFCKTLIADESKDSFTYNDFYSAAGYCGAKIVIYPETEVSMLEY